MTDPIRFVVPVLSVGTDAPLRSVLKSIAELGHLPVDLLGVGVLDFEPWDTAAKYIERSDYAVLLVGQTKAIGAKELANVERAFDLAVERHIPVLTMFPRRRRASSNGQTAEGRFFEKLDANPFGISGRYESGDAEMTGLIGRLFSTYTRPGQVSATEVPSRNVAEQLAALLKENQNLKRRLGEDVGGAASRRRETVVRLLQENKILIPLWYRGTEAWGQPVEMTLYDFFLRMGPELASEVSTEAAAEFIPVGVCGLEREDFRARWPVPSNNLNLWFTDLMAIGVVEPSLRKRRTKDSGQYWRLTEEGRLLLSDIRRSVLSDGGHRHVGFTSEFRIVHDVDTDA